jgi:hypothetical protein
MTDQTKRRVSLTRRAAICLMGVGLLGATKADTPDKGYVTFQELSLPPGTVLIYPTDQRTSFLQYCLSQKRECRMVEESPFRE